MRQPEPASHKEAIAEQFSYLIGASISSDIEILWQSAHHQVPNASSNKVGNEPMVL